MTPTRTGVRFNFLPSNGGARETPVKQVLRWSSSCMTTVGPRALDSLVRSVGLCVEKLPSARSFSGKGRTPLVSVDVPSGLGTRLQPVGSAQRGHPDYLHHRHATSMSVGMKTGQSVSDQPFRIRIARCDSPAIERRRAALQQRGRTAELRMRYELVTRARTSHGRRHKAC